MIIYCKPEQIIPACIKTFLGITITNINGVHDKGQVRVNS